MFYHLTKSREYKKCFFQKLCFDNLLKTVEYTYKTTVNQKSSDYDIFHVMKKKTKKTTLIQSTAKLST
jgi:hypothetical protein